MNFVKFCQVVFKNWKQFQCYQKGKKKVYTILIIYESQFKKKQTQELHGLHSRHGLQSAFYHDQYNHCRVQFTQVDDGYVNLEGLQRLFT